LKLAVSITHMDGVLYATYTGKKCKAQELLYHTEATVNAAKRHQCDRVLIVVNIVASYDVSVRHLALTGELLGSLPAGTRVAYNRHDVEHHPGVNPSITALHYGFFMGVARLHGVEVRAFETIHDAREWLGLAATNTAREQQELQAVHMAQANALRQARDHRNALLAQANQAL
jgi:hypothetical protein